mmetsp:Transcript_10649/g.16105  ORF Transcript_10649/g.16105 Transcript_10649/m.16105 type:complete len:178 (-) Transcript_10649:157-690(-)
MSNTHHSVMGLIRTIFRCTEFDFCAVFDAYSPVDNIVRASFSSTLFGSCSMLDTYSSLDGIARTAFSSALLVSNISPMPLAHTTTLGMTVTTFGGASDLGPMLRTNSSENSNIVATLCLTSLPPCPMRRAYSLGPHHICTPFCGALLSSRLDLRPMLDTHTTTNSLVCTFLFGAHLP